MTVSYLHQVNSGKLIHNNSMLKNLLSKLTGERYYPTTGWNKGSVVSNIFRAFEYVFGRKVGQRLESEAYFTKDENGLRYNQKLHTTEAHLVFVETGIKNFFINLYHELASYRASIQTGNWKELMDRVVNNPSPVFNTISVVLLGVEFKFAQGNAMFPFIMGAIGYQNTNSSSATNTTTLTYAATVSGSDTVMLAGHNAQGGDLTTGVTINGVAMSQVWKSNGDTGSAGFYGYNYVYFKQAPTTGNVVVSDSGGANWMRGSCAVYSGVDQLAPIDNFAVKNINSTSNSVTFYVTQSNCWIFTWYMQDNVASNTATPPSGYSQRSGTDSTQADSNTTVSTGDRTVAWGVNGTNRSTQIAVSFKPATGSLVAVSYQGNVNDYQNGGTGGNRAVSFKVLQDVTIEKVAMYATRGNAASGTFKLEILSGNVQTSLGTVLATTGTQNTTSLAAYGQANLAFTDFTLTTPVALTAGTQYYLKLTCLTGSGSDEVRWSFSNPASYLNGNAFIAASGDTTWTEYSGMLFGFQVTAQATVTSQIKTVAGVALASVKTITGVAIASVKNLAGVSNT